jgi:hypothetical protein
MKQLVFGLIATVMLSFSGFASTDLIKKNVLNETKTSKTEVKALGDCTACASVSVGGFSIEVCKTEPTCKAAIKALLAEL